MFNSLDSDENFKPEHTLFCRELRFVAIYALFGDLWAKKVPFSVIVIVIVAVMVIVIIMVTTPKLAFGRPGLERIVIGAFLNVSLRSALNVFIKQTDRPSMDSFDCYCFRDSLLEIMLIFGDSQGAQN